MRTAGAGRAAEEREEVDVAVRLVRAVPGALVLREEQGARTVAFVAPGATVAVPTPRSLISNRSVSVTLKKTVALSARLRDASRRPHVVRGARDRLVVGDLASRERHERCRRGARRVEGFVEPVVAGDVVRAGVVR